MFVRRSARAGVLPVLALSLALAGCGGDDEIEPKMPDSSSAASTSTAESPSPTEPVEPTLPPEAEGDDAAAAEAFVRHYFDTLNFAQRTGETSALGELALEDCAACRGSIEAIESTYAAGGVIKGGAVTITDLSASPRGSLGEDTRPFDARVTLRSNKQVIRGSGDNELDGAYPANRIDLQLQLVHGPYGWLMAEWSEAQ